MCTDNLDLVCGMQVLPDLAERYLLNCREEKSANGKHERFPNLAGFCRFCGFNGSTIERMKRDYPESYSALCMIFEDEALNSEISPSVLSVYLKKRLGYSSDTENLSSSCDLGQLKLVFEHDVIADGE